MRIGDRINLDTANNRKSIESIINKQGYARDVNQIATTYYCKDLSGEKYELVQFWNSRNIINVCSSEN